MKVYIKRIATQVVDNHGIMYSPVVYDLGYDEKSVIFEGVDGVKCGSWGVRTLALGKDDTLYLDFGQDWYVTGVEKIREELKTFL